MPKGTITLLPFTCGWDVFGHLFRNADWLLAIIWRELERFYVACTCMCFKVAYYSFIRVQEVYTINVQI